MTTPPTSFESFLLLGPEIALVLAALTAWLGGAFLGLRWGWPVALVGIGAGALLAWGAGWWGRREVLRRPVVQTLRQAAQ